MSRCLAAERPIRDVKFKLRGSSKHGEGQGHFSGHSSRPLAANAADQQESSWSQSSGALRGLESTGQFGRERPLPTDWRPHHCVCLVLLGLHNRRQCRYVAGGVRTNAAAGGQDFDVFLSPCLGLGAAYARTWTESGEPQEPSRLRLHQCGSCTGFSRLHFPTASSDRDCPSPSRAAR